MKNPRAALTDALITAWEVVFEKHYEIGGNSPDINCEAALQACYWSALRDAIQMSEDRDDPSGMPKNTRIFFEPRLIDKSGRVLDIRPDLIVCRNKMVIAAIELKYIPRIELSLTESEGAVSAALPFAGLMKDLRSLVQVHELALSGDVEFVHDRYRGQFDTAHERFAFSAQTLFVWAGVHSPLGGQGSFESLFNKFAELQCESKRSKLSDTRFFELHAVTGVKSPVRFEYFYGGTRMETVKTAQRRNSLTALSE